jgi:integrase
MPKLSQRFVSSLESTDQATWHWDDEVKGFHVRTNPGSAPVWGVRYIVNGKKLTKSLGPCNELKADQAREMAREYRRQARQGVDLAQEARDRRTAPTVTDLAKLHLELQVPPMISDEFYRDKKTMWNSHLVPMLGKVKVRDLSREHVMKLQAKFKDTPTLANRLVACLSKALNDCEQFSPPWRPNNSNPCTRFKRFRERPRERILSPGEIREVLSALDAKIKERPSYVMAIHLFKALMITGLRVSELSHRKWSEFDQSTGVLFIPKTKDQKPRNVNLSTEAVSLLTGLPRTSVWIFPNSTGLGPFTSPQKHWESVRDELGLSDVRLHDLRHTVASYAMQSGLSQRDVMELLGHSQMTTTARYLNVHSDRKQSISEKASRAITQFGAQ